jgi:hypothetical protein
MAGCRPERLIVDLHDIQNPSTNSVALSLFSSESLQEPLIRWLFLVLLIPEKCSSFALEDTGNPRVLVRNTLR